MALPAISLTWVESVEALSIFLRYQVYRRPRGEADWLHIASLGNRSQTFYADYNVPLAGIYEYAVTQVIDVSGDEVESEFQDPPPSAEVGSSGTFLHVVGQQQDWVELPNRGADITPQQDITFLQPWGRREPTAHIGQVHARRVRVDIFDRWDDGVWLALETLAERQAEGGVICYRDGRGERLFGVLAEYGRRDDFGGVFSAGPELQETYYDEAAS